jgi:hypothetical protein
MASAERNDKRNHGHGRRPLLLIGSMSLASILPKKKHQWLFRYHLQ